MEPTTTEGKSKNQQIWMTVKSICLVIVFIAAVIIINNQFSGGNNSDTVDDVYSQDSDCNVMGIELHGDLVTYGTPTDITDENAGLTIDETASQDIVAYIEQAEANEDIKAIILEIDSYGGLPVAGEEVNLALKSATKPTIAFIRSAGASAAYLSATGADRIVASKFSDVGGIGVTMSYLDYSKKNEKEGLTYIPLSSGKYKDTGSSDKALSQEEKELLMRDVNILHKGFIKMVAEDRKLDIAQVEKLADGSTMLGEMSLQNGLIDEIGGYPEVKNYLKDKIGEEVNVCW